VLRSPGQEVFGSGPVTIPFAEIIGVIPGFMAIAVAGDLPINIDEYRSRSRRPGALRRPADRPAALTMTAQDDRRTPA
jgi:hypothetical protein